MSINLTGSNDEVEATDALARKGNDEDQMGRGSLAMAWYGVASAMFYVYVGAAMALAYGTVNALIGVALTIVVYGVINAILSKYAINNRTTVAQFSRTILGTAGSSIATLIFALIAIYYAVFEGSIVAYAFQTQFGGEMWMWSLIVVLYSTPLIIGGVRRFLDKLNGWLLPIYFFGLIAASGIGLTATAFVAAVTDGRGAAPRGTALGEPPVPERHHPPARFAGSLGAGDPRMAPALLRPGSRELYGPAGAGRDGRGR